MSGIHPRRATGSSQHLRGESIHGTQRERRTARVLEGKAPFVHLVLLHMPTRQVVHVARAVNLHGEVRGIERPLFPNENVEVVVRGVHARVALGTDGRAEDDEVLGDARVDDVHRAHRAPSVVEHPLRGVGVEGDDGGRVFRGEVGDDVGDNSVNVIWVCLDRILGEGVEGLGIEDIPAVL